MATSTILLPINAAQPPDGSTSNLGPKLLIAKGTNTAPVRFTMYAAFVDAQTSNLWWTFYVPTNYLSGGTVRLMWAANATTNAVRWQASIGVQASSNADSYLAHQQATAVAATGSVPATTARRPVETTIALGANLDSMAADAIAYLLVQRLGADGADTATADAELLAVAFDYTS